MIAITIAEFSGLIRHDESPANAREICYRVNYLYSGGFSREFARIAPSVNVIKGVAYVSLAN
ncbi:hypothetical protein ACNQR9_16320 [Mycolicibacterium peregrinum]|uniref:hypothetical protein n=1 Tax=Mycolicibacterium peregrinum TaxID=43304 RepID=UPI003AAC0D76